MTSNAASEGLRLETLRFAALALLCLAPSAVFADTRRSSPRSRPRVRSSPGTAWWSRQEAAASRVGLDILQARRQRRRCGGRGRLRARGDAAARRQHRRRRLHADPSRRSTIRRSRSTIARRRPRRRPRTYSSTPTARPIRSSRALAGSAVGVPGTVAGLELAWRKYGSGKFSFADLIAPGDRARARGPHRRRRRRRFAAARRPRPGAAIRRRRASISGPTERAEAAGDHIALDDLAATLETIAARARPASTAGRSPQKIVDAVQAAGGRMTLDDLAELSRRRTRAGQRNLSRLHDRLDAAALVRRRAHHRNPQHSRRLSARPSRGSIPPPRSTRWPRRKSSPTPTARAISAIPISSRFRSRA